LQRPRRHGWGLLVVFVALAAASFYWRVVSEGEPRPREVHLNVPRNSTRSVPRAASRTEGVFAPLRLVPLEVPLEEAGARRHALTPSPGSPNPVAEGAPLGEKLTGRILRPDGTPIAGARLLLGNHVAETEPDGRYTLPLVAGLFEEGHLEVSHPDYFSRRVPLEAARSRELLVVLIPGGRIHGTVREPGGRPLRGAEVRFGMGELPPGVSTDEKGTFESPILPHKPVVALVVHPDYQPASSLVMPGAGGKKTRLDVTLVKGKKLRVHARSRAGTLLPDAKVWIRNEGEGVGAWNFLGATGDLGTLDTWRPEGPASIRVDLPGFRQATRPSGATRDGGEMHFSLQPAKALRGNAVERKSGLPVEITYLRLEVFNVLTEKFVEVADRGRLYKSLERGKFIVGLPAAAGTYRLAITAKGREDESRELRGYTEPAHSETVNSEPMAGVAAVAMGDEATPTSLVVRLEECLELHGVASGPKGPVPALEIELLAAPWNTLTEEEPDYGTDSERSDRAALHSALLNPDRLPVVETTTTGERGRFWFRDLRPRVYRLRARLEGFAEYLSAPFEVPWEGDYPVTLRRSATLSGTVLGPDDLPRQDRLVAIVRGDETARITRTDGRGTFVFRGLGPGEGYRVLVGDSRGGEQQAKTGRWLTIEEGKDVVYDVRLPHASTGTRGAPAATPIESPPEGPPPETPLPGSSPPELLSYTLKLLDASSGAPVEGQAEVELLDLEGESKWIGNAAGTSFAATRLRPGKYRLRVRIEKLLLHEADFDLQGNRKDSVRLQRASEVSVRLLISEDEPFRGRAEVVLLQGERELYKQVQMIDGSVTVPTPEVGEYELVVRSAERSARMRIHGGAGVPPE